MGVETETLGERSAASLIGWWAESGVDQAVSEFPRGWLKAELVAAPPPAAPGTATEKPNNLEAFRRWLAESQELPLARPGSVRIAPLGGESAPVMLLSDLPQREDAAAGRPIGGEAWELTQRMLAAIGIKPDDAYHALLACFHAPGARIGRDELESCGRIARDHVRLARPERLILLGDAPARALLGEPLARARGKVHRVEGVRTIATFHPRWLLQRPSDKALAWRDLLLLMSESE